MYNGVRHFLFIIPPLAVLGGLAAGFIIWMIAQKSQRVAIATALAMFAGTIVPVTDMVRIHPYQYANFNRIAGGIYEADDNFMLDYWGLAFKQAAQELRNKLDRAARGPNPGPALARRGLRPASRRRGGARSRIRDHLGAERALTSR